MLPRAGAAFVAAGACYLAAETVAADAFPGYSYARDYISDLGVPERGRYDGRVLDSPLAWVMNAGFVVEGVLFALAVIVAWRALAATSGRRRASIAALVLGVVHGAGIVIVGLVHGGPASAAAGIGWIHVLGAALAIIGGDLAVIVLARATRGSLPRALRLVLAAVAVLGLASLVMLEVQGAVGRDILWPDGVWERAAVYPVTLWDLAGGIGLLVVGARRRRRLSAR